MGIKVEGVNGVVAALSKREPAQLRVSVSVGYSQHYALIVHERLDVHHRVGQAKYLEQPAREQGPALGTMIAEALKQGKTMLQALLLAGLRLQAISQRLVPVDTGALRGSAFVRPA